MAEQRAEDSVPGSVGVLPAAVLAIDGGNSKTDVALIAADGTLLAKARSGGFQPQSAGVSTAVGIAGRAVADIRGQLGLAPGVPLARHLAAYVAGADFPVEVAELSAAFTARGWASSVTVENDMYALLRAGASRSWGVAVVAGAGVNCVGVGPDGRTSRMPALGPISGDWGGGELLGTEVLWHAVRSEDGRGLKTALEEAVVRHFGTATVEEVTLGMHFGEILIDRIHELAPLLFEVAATGDAVACQLVDRMGDEVAAMALVALRRLDLLGTSTEVVLGGGVLRGSDPRLMARIEAGLLAGGAQPEIVLVTAPPVLGAALLGLDHQGIVDVDVQRRVREAFSTKTLASAP